MEKILNKYQRQLFIIFAVTTISYLVVSFVVNILRDFGGDGMTFINDVDFVINKGWVSGIEKGISIPYTLLAYPFAFIMDTYYAMRLVNVLLTIGLFLYFFKVAKIEKPEFYCYLAFYLATIRLFFSGINDPLFIVGLSIFFTEVFYYFEKGKMNNEALAFSSLIVAFFTRELVLTYIPVILFAFFLLYKNGFRFSKRLLFPALLLTLMVFANTPSIFKNGRLSYEQKSPPSGAGVNWVQLQYLAQLNVNAGKTPNNSHPSWEETKAYLDANGPKSLPDGVLNGLTYDVKLTTLEFFKDFGGSLYYGFRQLGFIVLFPFLFVISQILRRKWSYALFLPIIIITVLCIFSLIIISFVELRWYGAIFIPAIVFFTFYSEEIKKGHLLKLANYIVLILMSFYGIYSMYGKF